MHWKYYKKEKNNLKNLLNPFNAFYFCDSQIIVVINLYENEYKKIHSI